MAAVTAVPLNPAPSDNIRSATQDDVEALVRLEERCFTTDRISRRSFKRLLARSSAATFVHVGAGGIDGYCMVLFHAGTSAARLYSMAVDPDAQGQGVGRLLLTAAEEACRARPAPFLRLEVRKDNERAITLYKSLGYREFGTIVGYYEDDADALRMERKLIASPPRTRLAIPFYEQTLEFTCGPACLMMAMRALDPGIELDRKVEMRLWREATTIFMTSGHGGCGPFGLALSATRRGFDVELVTSGGAEMFVDSVRSDDKKEVIRLVQEDMIEQLDALAVPRSLGRMSVADMEARYAEGRIPVVLISSFRMYHEKFPHWVVVAGFDDHFVYVHDPYVDYDRNKTQTDSIYLPIPKASFEKMTRYGKAQQHAVVTLGQRT